jgi:hypothetical protein
MIPHLPDELDVDLVFLGQEYVKEIQAVDSGRASLLADYQQFIRNYAGDVKPTEREKPWDGASEAHIPKSATDTDISLARLMNAAFGQFPAFMIRPLSAKWVEWARQTQRFSEWLEEIELPLYDLFNEAFHITVKFGTCVIYLPWEDQFINTYSLDANDQWVKKYENELGRPAPRAIHPENFLLPIHSKDPQTAPWCGYRYKLRPGQLKLWKTNGFFREAAADQLLAQFSLPQNVGHLTLPPGDTRDDLVQKTREEVAGLTRATVPDELDMVHIFARIDIDNDGVEEEVNFHLHERTGLIARISYTHYRHRRRPFIPLHFFRRDGIFFAIGILEMLKDGQKNLDVLMRQIQDNNTVKNTQCFVADTDTGLKPDEPFHPARIFFKRSGTEFAALRMGDIQMSTTIENLNTVATWLERRTGVADPAMDVGDRTPATTTLALLQEASRRIDLTIGGIRRSMSEFWMQVLQLYAQFKPVVEFEVETGDADGVQKFDLMEWHAQNDVDFRKAIAIKPTMSTSALNKAILRTEMQALNETVMAYSQISLQTLDMFLAAVDPSLKGYLKDMLTAQHKIMQRQVDTFEFAKDQGVVLPNPEKYLNAISPLQPPLGAANPAGAGAAAGVLARPQGLTPGPSGGLAPATAPGRPGAQTGVARQPTGGRSAQAKS